MLAMLDSSPPEDPAVAPAVFGDAGAEWTRYLSDHALVAELRHLDEWVSFAQARQVEVITALTERSVFARRDTPETSASRRRPDTEENRWARAAVEVSAALTLAPGTAAHQVGLARELTDDLPATLTALADGRISWPRARAIVEETRVLPAPARSAVEAKALAVAETLTTGKLRRRLARWVLDADPAAAADRHRRARAARCFQITPVEDGMATLTALLPADGAQTVYAAVDAVAATMLAADRAAATTATTNPAGGGTGGAADETDGTGRAPGEAQRRGVDQRRADALVAICRAVLDTGHTGCGAPTCNDGCTTRTEDENGAAAGCTGGAGSSSAASRPAGRPSRPTRLVRRHGQRPHIQVTVAASTLLGVDDLAAHLTGYGPITADQARRIAADGTWRRLLTDPTDGRLLHYGREHHDPPHDLVDHVLARDGTDRFPTSNLPAHRCDLDHAHSWENGGTTDPDNLNAVSPHLHQVRHDAAWIVTNLGAGRLRWTSPTGHTYLTHPDHLGPIASEAPGGTAAPSPATNADTMTTRDDDPPPF